MEIVGILFSLMFFAVVIILPILSLVFWIWMIIDCVTNEPSEGNDKIVWLLVILLIYGIGAIIYFFARRPERIAKYGK